MEDTILTEDTYEVGRWSLEDLLPSTEGPQLDEVLDQLEASIAKLESSRERLSAELSEDEFAELVAIVESIAAQASRLGAYSYLWYAEDTQNQDALAFRGRMEKLMTEVRNRTLFFTLWWKGLEDEAAQRLMAARSDVRYYFESLRRLKPHTLSEPEEKVINLKNVNGIDALVTVYEMITNSYTFKLEVEGELKEITRAELMVYARDPRPEVRSAVYQELYRVFGEDSTVLGQIYQHRVRDWASEQVILRQHASPLSFRNLDNDIPDDVVDTLLEVCRENAVVFQRYFRLKAQWLGMERLRRYDLYAPLSTSDIVYPFNQAATLVLDSLTAFSRTLSAHAQRVLAEEHLDSEVRARKDMGAFCYGVLPELTPWVLMSYTGTSDDVATLAHELGHAIHALMASEHSQLTFHSSLPLAETASVFAEMLLLERMLEDEPDAAVRRDLLARFVDVTYATVMRQAYFVLFEREAHALIEEGHTSDYLAERYMANLQEQFGDSLELSDEFRWEWISIPHIYATPFYCYAYSFGQLLVLALYKQFKVEGPSFVPEYLKILSYGGSKSPTAILDEAGIDMASPEFWQGGFDVIADMIQELEDLA
jgi:oligoendopeptidase F